MTHSVKKSFLSFPMFEDKQYNQGQKYKGLIN